MRVYKSWFLMLSVGALMLLKATLSFALDTQLTLQADQDVSPKVSELITFGLPIAEGEVEAVSEIKVMLAGVELPAYVEVGLRYHWLDNSIRSVTIQLHGIDMTGGDLVIHVTDDGAGVARVAEEPHSNGWIAAGANKNNHMYPRIFALHDREYLAQSGLVAPYEVAPDSLDAFGEYRLAQFNNWAGGLDFSTSTKANWLFDRSTALFKAYLSTGRVEFLKEAFLSKQFYFTYVRNDGVDPVAPGGSGCWTFSTVACADGKYIAPQQAKLAWALTGDDSQWDEQLIVKMALQADLGWNQPGTRDAHDSENEPYTERASGLVGLAEINAFEMTANSTVFAHLTQRIGSLKDLQQTEKSWDIDNGWTPKSGAFTHNINVHEGDVASLGATNERGFSVWMSENTVDFLWQTYWITGNPDIPLMLRKVANAADLYGFTSSYNSATNKHEGKPEFGDAQRIRSCNTAREETQMLYFASAYADEETRSSSNWWPWYTDGHNIQTVLTLSAGYYFEVDEGVRTRLKARIDKLVDGWSNENCAKVSNTPRLWNWQHRSNSVRTWYWISDEKNADRGPETPDGPPASPPASPVIVSVVQVGRVAEENNGGSTGGSTSGVAVFVASVDCNEGDDPHWQCGGRWTQYSDVEPEDYIAICPGAEASQYSGCVGSDRYVLASSVESSDGYFVCVGDVIYDLGRLPGCSAAQWVEADNFDNIGVVVVVDREPVPPVDNSPDAPEPPADEVSPEVIVTGDQGVSFLHVTLDVIDYAPAVDTHFWAGLPDVNGDGCFDLYIGAHVDKDSAMYLQNVDNGVCEGTFNYFIEGKENYAQFPTKQTRITSRYMFGNWYGHPDGLWSFYGHDVDGNPAARYVISPDTRPGDKPIYLEKKEGCFSPLATCLPLDVTGDGDIELVLNGFGSTNPLDRHIVDADHGDSNGDGNDQFVEYPSDVARLGDYGTSYIVFDLNNNGYAEVVSTHAGGYFSYSAETDAWTWVAGVFTNPIFGDQEYSTTNNHEVVLDYDNDGDLDIFTSRVMYSEVRAVAHVLSRNNGDGTFTDVSDTAGLDSLVINSTGYWTNYANSVVADLNLDGYPDILFSSENYRTTVTLMMNNGDGTFTLDRSINFGGATVKYVGKGWVNAADYDNDGKIDLVKTHERINDNYASVGLFKNTTSTDNNWLRVRVRGKGKNTDGLHARVTLLRPGTTEIISHYQVGAFTTGYQNLVTHAGAGGATSVDLLIQYPGADKKSQKFEGVSTNQDVVVFYSGGIIKGYQPGQPIPLVGN